jgi:squalene cyclase
MAEDAKYSLPIEIKSPTEELNISVKAVRQALENKVILLSRKSYVTDWNSSTIAVGYNPPNDRAEVSRLITDIRNTFNIHVGIIDFGSLLKLAVATVRGDGCSHIDEIRKLEGMIDVEII